MSRFGLLNINKPAGETSRQVIDRVQQLVRPDKVGHAGTLDPLATGVLVVAVGPATRLIEYVQQMPKRYRGGFLLGCESETEDVEGDVRQLENPPVPSREEIEAAAARLTGEIEQQPPKFSALKVKGRRAYDLARKGKAVSLKPRKVMIHRLEVASYDYPELRLDIECGGGTYIRSLGRDLAQSLGTAAVMNTLERTAVGPFHIADAISPAALTETTLHQRLLSPVMAVDSLPQIPLTGEEVEVIAAGRTIERDFPEAAPQAAALDHAGNLIAIVTRRSGGIGPVRNFAARDS